jgi:hypothetical protein
VARELKIVNNLQFRFDLLPGVTFTNLRIVEGSRIADQIYSASYKFHSINASFQPTVGLHKSWGLFGIKAYAGFHMALYSGKLKFDENKDSHLTNGGNEPIVANWNGFRVGLTGTYRINGKGQSEFD